MLPYIHILGRDIPMYGLLGMVGILLGMGLAALRCPKFGLDREDCVYVYVWGAVGALVGAKVLFLLTVLPNLVADFHYLWEDPEAFVAVYITGGLVFYGGLIGAVAGAALATRYFGWRLRDYLPVLIPVFPLIHAIGRVGCFCAGCCYGKPAEWGIAFTQSLGAPNGVKLIPVQLIECGCELVICAVLVWYASRRPRGLRLLGLYGVLYAPVRFGLEFLRGDLARGHVLWLSTSQWISIGILAAGIVLLAWRWKEPSEEASSDGVPPQAQPEQEV